MGTYYYTTSKELDGYHIEIENCCDSPWGYASPIGALLNATIDSIKVRPLDGFGPTLDISGSFIDDALLLYCLFKDSITSIDEITRWGGDNELPEVLRHVYEEAFKKWQYEEML